MDFALSRGRAFLFVLITWVIVYLPGLGREVLKREERVELVNITHE